MFCSQCGTHAPDGARFCQNCGASLTAPGGIVQQPPAPINEDLSVPRPSRRSSKAPDPYKEPIAQLKLQIRQLKLDLKQINTKMSGTRSQFYETDAFVPEGILRKGYKMLEDARLLGPQQQKQQLQQQIMQFEQQLLGLQQAQAQWKAQQ